MKRSQHHFGVFYQQDSRCTTPWPAPSTSCVCQRVCVCLCVKCVCPAVFACVWSMWRPNGRQQPELWENWEPAGLWRTTNRLLLPQPAAFCRGNFEKLLVVQLDTGGKVGGLFLFFCLSSEKKRERKKERRGPSGLTAPFILYYPAWLLTPGELCSQIDALLLWGCSRNIKLYWNIHMWVHLAESNWCATP